MKQGDFSKLAKAYINRPGYSLRLLNNIANVPIEWDTSKPKGDPRRVFDMSRAASFGFYPEISIEEGIKETIDWYLENKEFADTGVDVFKSLAKELE